MNFEYPKHANLLIIYICSVGLYGSAFKLLPLTESIIPLMVVGVLSGIGIGVIEGNTDEIQSRLLRIRDLLWFAFISPFIVFKRHS